MRDTQPQWLPEGDEGLSPKPQQQAIIDADAYPLRVLAGAGTGKTFTMVRKIEHLVDEKGVPPNRILALTFTNKAADSMREKLNATLGSKGFDVDAYTYHSICNDVLSDYAYHAAVDPDYEIAIDADKYALVYDVLDEIPYRFIDPDVHDPDSWGTGVIDRVLKFIAAMKRSGIPPADLDAYLGTAERLVALQNLPDRIEAHAGEHLRGITCSDPAAVDDLRQALADMQTALRSEQATLDTGRDAPGIEQSIDAFLEMLCAACDALADTFAHRIDQIGCGDLEYAHKLPAYLFGGYSGPPKGIPKIGFTFPEKLRSYLATCTQARDLTDGYAAYEAQLAERSLLDYDDLVRNTLALLEDDAVRETVAGQWDYVFCDEFQDTDPLQFELVQRLVSDEQLFVVGDDDQAIYEWRGANVENITDELHDAYGSALTDLPLEENFRSHQPILDLANEALQLVDERGSDKQLTRVDPPEYSGTPIATIEAPEDDVEAGAEQIAKTISHLLAGDHPDVQRPFDLEDIAVLVRKNRHAAPLVRAFREYGIPYQTTGDIAPDSAGVQTVLAYLKGLAAPREDEVSWNRVLTMRYRLHDADLRRLNAVDAELVDALREVPREEFVEPERVDEARDHIEYLLERRDVCSVTRLYRELKETTDIERYLSSQERRDLADLDAVIRSFGDGTIQPELDQSFIDFLAYQDSITQEADPRADQPDTASGAVNVMTIHKSKGLDFPVVLLPELTGDQWTPSERSYGALNRAVSTDARAAFDRNFERRDADESRRVLHVAMTRAEELLVLQGRDADVGSTAGSAEIPFPFVNEALGETVPWEAGGISLPIWQNLQTCLTTDVDEWTDWTDSLAASWARRDTGQIHHHGETFAPDEARERVLALADAMLAGSLQVEEHADTLLSFELLDAPASAQLSHRHSYTSLETYAECSRKHYLDHVVRAFPDYQHVQGDTEEPSQQSIGVLFHDTAEQAFREGADAPEEWYDVCERLATSSDTEASLSAAKACIDRFFETDVSNWELRAAERPFTIDVDGYTLTGKIDALFERPDGERVVIDYKATQRTRSLDENRQLPIYLLACKELFDDPPMTAGYVYVGDIGPDVSTRAFTESDLEQVRRSLHETLAAIKNGLYADFTAGEHCQWCPHRSLPCSNEVDCH